MSRLKLVIALAILPAVLVASVAITMLANGAASSSPAAQRAGVQSASAQTVHFEDLGMA